MTYFNDPIDGKSIMLLTLAEAIFITGILTYVGNERRVKAGEQIGFTISQNKDRFVSNPAPLRDQDVPLLPLPFEKEKPTPKRQASSAVRSKPRRVDTPPLKPLFFSPQAPLLPLPFEKQASSDVRSKPRRVDTPPLKPLFSPQAPLLPLPFEKEKPTPKRQASSAGRVDTPPLKKPASRRFYIGEATFRIRWIDENAYLYKRTYQGPHPKTGQPVFHDEYRGRIDNAVAVGDLEALARYVIDNDLD